MPTEERCGNADDEDCDGSALPAGACLIERGLLVRYFIDEASRGQGPQILEDAGPEPRMPLTLSYSMPPQAEFATADSNHGIKWVVTEADDKASAPVDGTKLKDTLQGSYTVTIEVVAELDAVSADASRLLEVSGQGELRVLSLASSASGEIDFWINGAIHVAGWNVPYSGERRVLHAVLDTTLPAQIDRARLYIDGIAVGNPATSTPLVQDATLNIADTSFLVVGNRNLGARSLKGTIYYVAIYSAALDAAEVARNADLLLLDDDGP